MRRRTFAKLLGVSAGNLWLGVRAPSTLLGASDPDWEAAKVEIAATLDRLSLALATGDVNRLNEIVDPNAIPLRRVLTERVRDAKSNHNDLELDRLKYEVLDLRPARHDFVKADLKVTRFPAPIVYEGVYVFQPVNGSWRLTEPTERELGERREFSTGHFRIRYYEWDAAQIDAVGLIFEQAWSHDVAKIGYPIPDQLGATLNPTLQNVNLNNRAYAYYTNGTLHVRSPESFGYGLHRSSTRDDALLATLRHEYGHHIVAHELKQAGYPDRTIRPWMNEGFAEWCTDRLHWSTILAGLDDDLGNDGVLEWADARLFNTARQLPADVRLAYALSTHAVLYIESERGGIAEFWRFVRAFLANRSLNISSQAVFGQSWPDFQHDYRAWLEA